MDFTANCVLLETGTVSACLEMSTPTVTARSHVAHSRRFLRDRAASMVLCIDVTEAAH